MTMRKLDILWKRHIQFKYPKTEESKANVEIKADGSKREIGKDERVFIDALDF